MKIFFYGGTFDPPHRGHKLIVDYCLSKCDKLILIPNYKSPHKSELPIGGYTHRVNMLKILFNYKNIDVSYFESSSKRNNYTYITIDYLIKKYKSCDLTMIIGYDQLNKIDKWKNIDWILKKVKILCFNRYLNNDLLLEEKYKTNIKFIKNFNVEISSSIVRNRILNDSLENTIDMLDSKIIKYISENKIYV